MRPDDLTEFNQAVAQAQSGQKSQAHARLLSLAERYPNDTNLLLWLAFTTGDLSQARAFINKIGQLEPNNASLGSARDWLAGEEAKQVPARYELPPPMAMNTPAPMPYSSPNPQENVGSQPLAYVGSIKMSVADHQAYQASRQPKARSGVNIVVKIVAGVVAGFVLLGLLVIGLLLFVSAAYPDSFEAQGLPVYKTARHLPLSSKDKSQVSQAFSQGFAAKGGTTKVVNFEIYIVPMAERKTVHKFYETELKKLGWVVAPVSLSQNGMTAEAYTKNPFLLATITVRLDDSKDAFDDAAYQLKENEVYLMVMKLQNN